MLCKEQKNTGRSESASSLEKCLDTMYTGLKQNILLY